MAVLQDAGDMMTKANPLDLGDVGLRLTANASGGFDVSRIGFTLRQPLGDRLTMADDDTKEITLPFVFPFFGTGYDRVFVNSDGNLTLAASDTASSERSVGRFLSGPPRIAAFFADLDPSRSGAAVLTHADGDALTVTWCAVPEYGRLSVATVQATLQRDGVIEIHVSSRTTARSGVIGVSPGATSDFEPVDLSAEGTTGGGTSAVGEQFTDSSSLDVVAAARRFYQTHPDQFDNLVFFTDTQLLTEDAFAYESLVANRITGINQSLIDYSSEYGSAGQLESVCNMDTLSKYPDDPFATFLGENSTVSVMGQEIGHRWSAFMQFRDYAGRRSSALLGRDQAHWSFFFDSDASVMEGNDIEDRGNGSFRTVAAVQRYSLLDQYAMGLVDETQVPPSFYVENPANVSPRRTATSNPTVGVTFTGTRRNVTIDDIIAVHGRRNPSAADSPRVYRQAFVYIVSPGTTVDPAAVQKIDRIRVAWDQFFSQATDSRMRAETRLLAE
ncbi:MAG TPA: hypothetical protein VGQ37_21910 [Vicinamibacterales bacterium]|nr:hypothetical protein [Vicinamibacterales bacterium]